MTRSKEYINSAIAEISEIMKGTLSDFERRMLHEDRKELRKILAEVEQEAAKAAMEAKR